jgi:hypothetical protein
MCYQGTTKEACTLFKQFVSSSTRSWIGTLDFKIIRLVFYNCATRAQLRLLHVLFFGNFTFLMQVEGLKAWILG